MANEHLDLNELDVKVAEKVFGLRIDEKRASTKVVWDEDGKWDWLVPYSTTWNGMQLVVEEMQRRGWDFALESVTYDGIKYHARFFERLEGGYGEYDSEESFPHAVCIAAICALEGQEDE